MNRWAVAIGAVTSVVVLLWTYPVRPQVGERLSLGETCSYFGEQLPSTVTTFDSDREAEDIVRSIVRASGLSPNFTIRVGGVPNAAAVIMQGKRYIVYDQYFVRKLTQTAGTRWAATSVMAHEIGHHLNGHTLEGRGSRPGLELEADLFSGFILQRLGASLDDARKAMEIFGSPTGSQTHPAKHDRLAAITKGWTQSCDSDTSCRGSSPPVERPSPQRPSPSRPDPPRPEKREGPDSCEYARDGTCDEPDLCPRGTDTTDCRRQARPPREPDRSGPVFCCDGFGRKWCQITMGSRTVGAPCGCAGVPGSGVICP